MKSFALIGVCCALLAGCMSYRLSSYGEGGRMVAEKAVQGRYRIVGVQIDCARGLDEATRARMDNPWAADPWSILQVAAGLKNTDVISAIRERTPGVCEDVNAVPVEIKVISTMENSELGATFLVPYLVSLGTLPAFIRRLSDCRIEVAIGSGEKRRTYSCQRRFVADSKMTCFTPIGLIDYDRDFVAIEQQLGTLGGVGNASTAMPIRMKFQGVFAGTVAKFLGYAISSYEEGK